MKQVCSLVLFICLMAVSVLGLFGCGNQPPKTGEYTKYTDYDFSTFDTVTTVIGYAKSRSDFDKVSTKVKTLLGEYHKLYNIYNTYPGIANMATVNSLEGGSHPTVTVDQRIIDLLLYCKELFTLTGGEVNVAMGSVLKIWHSHREAGKDDPVNATLPSMDRLEEAAKHTDIEDLIIDDTNNTVHLKDPQMYLDVGAVAKGYATEMVARALEADGISGYLLNVGGNVRAIGTHPDGGLWSCGIENPDKDPNRPYITYLQIPSMSLVTSGVYERFYTVNGTRYHHLIDKDTLMPENRYLSVTVLTPYSHLADGLSTALFCMTEEEGRALLEQLPGTEVLWVLPDGTTHTTKGFDAYCYTPYA